MLDLTDFLNTATHPHTAFIAVGGGAKLHVTFRAPDPARAEAAILAAAGEGLAALGLDPLTVLKAAAGQVPKGEAQAALTEVFAAMDDAAEKEFLRLVALADGAGIADVLGSWEAVLPTGAREAITGSPTAEACAALPPDLKKAILGAVNAAVLPVEKLDFLAGAPASSPGARRGGSGKAGS